VTLRALTIVALVLCTGLTSAPLFAETRDVEARGEAAGGGEPARVQAIDAALAQALGSTLAEVVPAAQRRTHGKAINDKIVRHARRFVSGFRVLDQGESEGRLRLRLVARVDMDKLRDALGELGIELAEPGPATAPRPKMIVLVHATIGDDTAASFGERGQDGGPAGQALVRALRELGFDIVNTAGRAVPVSRETPQGLPLSDQAAAEMARQAGAGGAFVVGLRAEPDGQIRGTSQAGARGRAAIRVLDLAGRAGVVARAEIAGAGFADSMDQALAAAAADLITRLVLAVAPHLAQHWPPALAAGDEMLIEVDGVSGWQHVRPLMEHLAGTRGIDRVWPRHLGRRGVILGVATSMDRRRVAAALRRATVPGAAISVHSSGDAGLRISLQSAEAQP
jgi:hypothetical protein